jgi:hypothetical protein
MKLIRTIIIGYLFAIGVLVHVAPVAAVYVAVVVFEMPLSTIVGKVAHITKSGLQQMRRKTMPPRRPLVFGPNNNSSSLSGRKRYLPGASSTAVLFPQLYDQLGRPLAMKSFPADDKTKKNIHPYLAGNIIEVKNSAEFLKAIRKAKAGDVITLAAGIYHFKQRAITVKKSGSQLKPIVVRADKLGEVQIKLDTLEGFHVKAPYWIFENLDIQGVCQSHSACEHAFHIVGYGKYTVLRNNVIQDFNAHIKGNELPFGNKREYPDDVLIEGNTFFNSTVRNTGNPVTPIDVGGANNWVVKRNLIADFSKGRGNRISYAAFFKGGSAGAVFEQNLVICEMTHFGGVRLGLSFGGGGAVAGSCRSDKGTCEVEHTNGIIRNNIIMHCPLDVGIYLNKAANSKIYNNILYNTRGIDNRFPKSTADIRNNILTGRILDRDGSKSVRMDNLIRESGFGLGVFTLGRPNNELFIEPDVGDFTPARVEPIAGKGSVLPEVKDDFCGNIRPEGSVSLGAIEIVKKNPCPPLNLHYGP